MRDGRPCGNGPLVSVVIPVYRVEEYLNECVSSVLSQTYRSIEVLLVDDGSPDECPGMCDAWALADDRVKVIHQENGGLSSARNAGLAISHGDYVLFVDSDDVISSTLIEKCVGRMIGDGSEVCVFKYALFDQSITSCWDYKESPSFPTTRKSDANGALSALFEQHIHNYAQMRMTSRELYSRIGFSFPEGRLMEDLATTASVLGEARSVSYEPQVLYFYRQRGGSIVAAWSHLMSQSTRLALLDVLAYVREAHPQAVAAAYNYATKMLFYCWKSEPVEDASGVSRPARRREIARWIEQFVGELGPRRLTVLNRAKYLAMRFHVLGCVVRLLELRMPATQE